MSAAEIFLSYSREDAETARRFADSFEREGLRVWWDATLRSGEAYDEVTEKALRDAKAVVVLWSRKSVVSRWVRAEATLADRNRTLVPAMIEFCDRPIMFELTQTADLTSWNGDIRDVAWRAFATDVRRLTGGAGPATSAERPAASQSIAVSASSHTGDLRPSLAVLPFTNRSGQVADDVFADGMVEDLVSALSMSRAIKVIAPSATLGYRKNASDLRTIGRELGVRYLLEGNVRRVGTTLRVSAQLVEAENGAILWTQKFDRPLSDLAELQERLVIEVAAHLGVQIQLVEAERALRKPGDINAWEAVVRCSAAFARMTHDSTCLAVAEARKAVTIAPDYALGHAALASALSNLFYVWRPDEPERAREARAHADQALRLDSSDPLVLAMVGNALGNCGVWEEGHRYLRRAVELNPNLAVAHQYLAQFSLHFDQPDDALRHATIALELAPRGHMLYFVLGYHGLAHFQAGRFEEALQAIEQALLLNPAFIFSLKDKAVYCEKLGRSEEARETVRRLRASDPGATLEGIEKANLGSFIARRAVIDMNATFRKVWLDTPFEPAP